MYSCNVGCIPCVMTKTPMFVNHRHPISNTERLSNKTHQQVSYRQTTIEGFGRRVEGRLRATGIGEFPRNVVMERIMSTAAKQFDSFWCSPTKEGEHCSSWCDFMWLLPLLKFVVDIILSSVFPFSCRFLFLQRKIVAKDYGSLTS